MKNEISSRPVDKVNINIDGVRIEPLTKLASTENGGNNIVWKVSKDPHVLEYMHEVKRNMTDRCDVLKYEVSDKHTIGAGGQAAFAALLVYKHKNLYMSKQNHDTGIYEADDFLVKTAFNTELIVNVKCRTEDGGVFIKETTLKNMSNNEHIVLVNEYKTYWLVIGYITKHEIEDLVHEGKLPQKVDEKYRPVYIIDPKHFNSIDNWINTII